MNSHNIRAELSRQFDADRVAAARLLAEEAYAWVLRRVVADLKALPRECRPVGDDWPRPDFWEDFKYQVQREEFLDFDTYKETVLATCAGPLDDLRDTGRGLMWLFTSAFNDWDGPPE